MGLTWTQGDLTAVALCRDVCVVMDGYQVSLFTCTMHHSQWLRSSVRLFAAKMADTVASSAVCRPFQVFEDTCMSSASSLVVNGLISLPANRALMCAVKVIRL